LPASSPWKPAAAEQAFKQQLVRDGFWAVDQRRPHVSLFPPACPTPTFSQAKAETVQSAHEEEIHRLREAAAKGAAEERRKVSSAHVFL
jgi:hypothetical protein